MLELVDKRSLTAKHFELGLSPENLLLFRAICNTGHIHFQDGPLKDGLFRNIDTTPEYNPITKLYSMTQASYEAEIGLYGRIRFHNVDHSIEFQLPNPNRVQAQGYEGSVWCAQGKGFIWRDIIQDGGHQIVECRNGSLAKIFRFEKAPESNVIEFLVSTSEGVSFQSGVDRLDVSPSAMVARKSMSLKNSFGMKGPAQIDSVLSIVGQQETLGTEDRTSWIRQPRCWNHRGEGVDVELLFFQRDGELWAQKIIPQAFIDATFIDANAWLECDTTTSFYTGSGDGVYQAGPYSEAFATLRGEAQSNATTNGTTGNCARVDTDYSTYCKYLYRSPFPIDSSSLTSAVLITDGTFNLRGYAKANNAGSNDISLDHFTSLDFAAGNTVRQASDIAYASFDVAGWNVFTLNATGLGNINKTGTTYFGTRLQWDMDNGTPGSGSSLATFFQVYFSEGAYPPYLSVTYTFSPPLLKSGPLLTQAVYRM